jgi:hypothetical protein
MMKKGFLLSVLVVAVVAIAVPAGARAPIVNPLPDIIIGDVGDVDAGTGKRLLRYLDIVNVGAEGWIKTQNGMGTTNLSIYYASYSAIVDPDSSVLIRASNTTAIIDPLTDVQRQILTGSLIPPPGEAKKINGGGFAWLSLINTAAAAGTLVDAYSATPVDDGLAPGDFPAGWDDPSTLTIYALERAWDGAATVPLLSTASSLAWSVIGVDDRQGTTNPLADLDFSGGTNGWVPGSPAPSLPDYDVVGAFHNGRGLAFTAPGDNTTAMYGLWQSGTGGTTVAPFISADEVTVGEDSMIHLTATLGSDAATAADCPGYRIHYAADAFQHSGGMLASTYVAGGPSYAPATGVPFDAHLYWAVPYGLTQYRDGELLSDFGTVNPGFADARDYKLQWELVDQEAADAGDIWLSRVQVEALTAPMGNAPAIAWGGTNVPFNDALQGFQESLKQPVIDGVTWPRGKVVYGPGGTFLDIGAGIGVTGYQEAAPRPTAFNVGLDWTADKLVRYRSTWAAATNVNSCPQLRILVIIWRGTGAANLLWVDEFGGNGGVKFFMELAGMTSQEAPAAPKATGSVLSTYYYTHGGNIPDPLPAPQYSDMAPTVDVYNAGQYDGTTWPNQTGLLRLSSFVVEDGI